MPALSPGMESADTQRPQFKRSGGNNGSKEREFDDGSCRSDGARYDRSGRRDGARYGGSRRRRGRRRREAASQSGRAQDEASARDARRHARGRRRQARSGGFLREEKSVHVGGN